MEILCRADDGLDRVIWIVAPWPVLATLTT
jgi:hypothetical protein